MTYDQQKPESIQKLFASIAKDYDRGNATLSFQLHRYWNRSLAKLVAKKAESGTYLDLCAGTGDIAFALFRLGVNPKRTILLDFCSEMLEVAKTKCPKNHFCDYLVADATKIPIDENSIDAITIAYGVRNLSSTKKCFLEMHRSMKPGGVVAILELTRPKNFLFKGLHFLYLNTLLPLLGKLVAKNKEAYSYLSSSIQNFSSPEKLASELEEAGFSKPEIIPLLFGTATLIKTTK